MKKTAALVVLLLALAALAPALEEGRFFRYPSIAGDRIVFTYEADLWSVSAQGGVASRLTTFPGTEAFAKLSPDGKWLAFSAQYDGAQAVYLMPAEGGAPVRLTYNPGTAQVVGWTPDGRKVIYRSSFENFIGRDPNLYTVPVAGGAPERFPTERGVLASFSADGRSFLYNRRGVEEYYWKRYKGGQYMDIWMYDGAAKTYTPVTDYVGKNAYPMWIGETMYFVSDRDSGVANLYAQKIGTKEAKPVTRYGDVDVMMPHTDGRSIVYVQDGRLHVLDVRSGQDRRLEVRIPSDRWALRTRVINPRDYIQSGAIGNDGRTVLLEARGDVFRVPVGRGTTDNLSATPGTRETLPILSPDGKTVAFFSDKTGDYQLYTQPAQGGAWTPITTGLDRKVYKMAWSPDGTKILFGNKDFSIFYVDLASKKLVKVDSSNQMKNDEFYWEVADYVWSPDSKWIAYSFVQYNRNSQIFLYSLETGRKVPVTDDFYDNLYPAFDASGRWLYYVSSRNFEVQMDFYEDNHVLSAPQQVVAVQLRDGEAPPFSAEAAASAKADPGPFRIDLEGLRQRSYPLPVAAGNLFYLKAGKGKVLWASVAAFTETEYEEIFKPKNGETKWSLHIFDMAERRETILADPIRDFSLSADGSQLLIRREADWYATSVETAFASKSAGARLNVSGMVYTVDLQKEWLQIFNDAWRWYRDFFYDAGVPRPRLEGHGRLLPGLHPPALLA